MVTTDLPLARALRFVERLIAQRLAALQAKSQAPETTDRKRRQLHQRADELGVLIGEIRQARYGKTSVDA